ncbi:MAG: poly-beta-hydroxybutyrate polymerase [Comamonas sp. SCN 67-35]|uniref:PHA/PHB synthase family protein n=1 Tax=unclassified Comamonas TaxID=2638500 RepID=UPI00086CE0B4|nr:MULTISPECIES: alpha/beta fold hydrolase [unclassified Comamonas]MBN9330289.1 polyhydroxyalkanoic acid synthase [Comamonas sp.]ODU37892.1 MAG: poly-beta-hydroxybutyrate polymerase [Comamonas sp. SCN 67-35]OJW98701.1 MAG: poly-beta-hydroxybutyrate polymerase [Burkholderiales bacterium 66-26]
MNALATPDRPAPQPSEACRTDTLDTLVNAWRARSTGGLSPAAGMLAWYDWALHLSLSPGKQRSLIEKGWHKQQRLARYTMQATGAHHCPACIEPLEQDRRFAAPAWQRWPFNVIHQAFLLQQQWWHNATTDVRGVSRHHEKMVTFAGRQWLDMWSPSNFIWTNPEVLDAIRASGGANLWHGAMNFLDDARRLALDEAPAGVEGFEVGKDVAVTPGKVVFRNHLIELIQYTPTTPDVHAEPVLIVPSWIMKYYILDLSPQNSMVKYLVEQGHTVFIISWKNPTAADRDLGLEDYRRLGVMDALDTVTAIVPGRKVQAVGYCLGGTLLTIAAAAMARDGDARLQSLTLLASETDFHESGEIALFIDESQLAWLEAGMWDKGYLDGKQMAGAFQMLNSRDLIWSRRVREYLLGERQAFNDLMAWNADVTRMPYRMHSEYLRRLYLDNDLAEGRYRVGGKPVAIADIEVPMFIVGTVRDHVAPWPSVYKMHLLSDAELTFVLTSGGHNAGVVSEPGHPRRSFQIATRAPGDRYVDPQQWRAETPLKEGSWWPAWQQWLAQRSAGRVAPPAMGLRGAHAPLGDAPGTYVKMR